MNIYIGTTTLTFTTNKLQNLQQSFSLEEVKKMGAPDFLRKFENTSDSLQVNIFGGKKEEILDVLKKELVYLEAGGGLVQNPQGEILFIYRLGHWDLPKGKPEKNENMEETAIREVEEECGVSKLSLLNPLPSTWHVYRLGGGALALKQSYWYHMLCRDWETLNPQTEENITDARWEKMPVQASIMDNAWLSIRELVNHFQHQH